MTIKMLVNLGGKHLVLLRQSRTEVSLQSSSSFEAGVSEEANQLVRQVLEVDPSHQKGLARRVA